MRLFSGLALALGLVATPTFAAKCGGDFDTWVQAMRAESSADGASAAAIDRFFQGAAIDKSVLQHDRGQSFFRKSFLEFSQSLISKNRIQNAAIFSRKYDAAFGAAEAKFGVSRGIILAFWAFETDFGQVQGDFNTRNALVTLAHDCRRPDIFQPQVLAAIHLTETNNFNPASTTGAWAGEIGQVQMLPRDIYERGEDGDGDGRVTLKTSAPDAILSAAHLLQFHGWQAGQPWLQEVTLPAEMDWSQSSLGNTLPTSQWAAMGVQAREGRLANLPASLLLPQGRKGPAFLAYPNYKVLFEWNKSFVYVTTAAYFANRIQGAAPYDSGHPDPTLSVDQMMGLQKKLTALGRDVGKPDGILGAATRAAVQLEQKRLGLPADGWPTADLLGKL